jgi:hypothetical protein
MSDTEDVEHVFLENENWIARGATRVERNRILSIIAEYAQRYSRGSVTRVALDNLILEIKERT